MRTLARLGTAVLVAALVFGCTAMRRDEADKVESTLAAAGFKMRPADTPEKLAKLQALPLRKLTSRVKDGEPIYFYADPDFCKCLYAGSQGDFARYKQLAIQQRIAQEQMEAAEMNENTAMDWGMWGPFW
ncbi:MAG: hypothetical protein ABI629_13210 [bacterium]